MQDSLLEMKECKLGYVYLKHKLSGGSILSATISAATEGKHFGIFLLFRRLNLPLFGHVRLRRRSCSWSRDES